MYYDDFPKEMDTSFYYMAWLVERFAQSWGKKVRELKAQIERERPDEVDHIYNEVKDQARRIVVENERPEEATIEIHGVRIKKKIVHGKSEKYNGADVYIEIQNGKFALTQFKLQSGGRYQFDREQLKHLSEWCEFCKKDKQRPLLCPAYVWLIDDSKRYYNKHRIVRLCQLENILEGRGSAKIQEFDSSGITRSAFKELLVKCWAGAPLERRPSIRELESYATKTKRLVVRFVLRKLRGIRGYLK